MQPNCPEAENNLANALFECKRYSDAIVHYERAIALKPDYADAHHNLGNAMISLSRFSEAVIQYRAVLQQEPERMDVGCKLAMVLAACPDASIRDGTEAVRLAQNAVERSNGGDRLLLDILAAAYAEANRFPEAIRTARQALQLVPQAESPALAEAIGARLRLYESNTPFRGNLLIAASKKEKERLPRSSRNGRQTLTIAWR
jgi:tetratricopeptide (TPR) repeat protein